MSAGPRAPALFCLTFDNMAEAAEIGAGRRSERLPAGEDPSLAIGYPAVFALLERHALRATFFVEGWNGVHHPAAVAEIARRGHELGMHGWVHEEWSRLEPEREHALAERATRALAAAAGVRPRGFRAPGGARSANSATILAALGYEYDASLGVDGMRPTLLDSGLVQIPFVWPAVDGVYYLADPPVPPDDVARRWLAARDKAAAAGGLFVIICHAFLTGVVGERLTALERVIAAAVADARMEICTVGEAAAKLRAGGALAANHSPLPS